MTRVILVDDHKVVRDGIKLLLEAQEDFLVLGEGDNGKDALDLLGKNIIPDIIITDMNMLGMDGISLLQEVKNKHKEIKVVFLSMVESIPEVKRAIDAGASAYLLKNVGYEEILFALNRVRRGGEYISGDIGFKLLANYDASSSTRISDQKLANLDISAREHEVLQLLTDGFTTNEIADKLFVSKRTVEGHRQKLLEKTGSKNYANLIKYAIKNRWVN